MKRSVEEGLEVPDRGLDSASVAARAAAGLTNAFAPHTSRGIESILRANVLTVFNGVIVLCFIFLLAIGQWQDALFGFAAVMNSLIGSVQEFRAKRTLDRLALLNAPRTRVFRDDREVVVDTADVVIDDLLILRTGDQVPADAIITRCNCFEVDESMLTGESEPLAISVGDRILSGSIVVRGDAAATASRVGAESFANSLVTQARRFSLAASELQASSRRVLKWMLVIVGPVALLMLNSQMTALGGWRKALANGDWREAATSTVAGVVAMIPLGLTLMISIAFAVGAMKLARQHVLIQELGAVEILARIDTICLDKTGTLTRGGVEFETAAIVDPRPGWEGVLAWFGAQADANATARSLSSRFTEIPLAGAAQIIPFSSDRKWSSVVFGETMWLLGAPDVIFPSNELSTPAMREFTAQAGASAADGRRTLVLAVGTQTNDENVPVDAVPVALVTFREEIRGDAAETLSYFAAQGVEIRILSGDHPQTAAAIARDVGLNAPDGFDARGLPEDDADLLAVLKKYPVFGRVTPEQKRRIIMVLRAAGHVVAMTGDGVNDLPAIKEADIGIAMNSGAASTRAVAKIVLLDGRFSHLPGVVAEGRRVIANIERVSMLFLTKTAYATLLTIAFAIIALPFPFLPRQLSVTDGLTIGIPAFFLALLPNADRYIPGFLRRALTFAIPAGLVIAIALVVYGLVADEMSVATEEMRTGATLILSISGLGVLLVLCNPLTPAKISIVMAMAAGVALAFTMPAVREFFEFSDLSPRSIASVCFVSATALVLILLVRVAMRRIEATRKDSPHHAVRLEHTVTQVDSQPASVREKKARG